MTVAVFPTFVGLTFPVDRTGPTFDTVVQDSVSGKQTAFIKRLTPKWTWSLPLEFLRSQGTYTEWQTLAGFFASCYGRAYPFAYTDQEDNAASAQLFGTGDGVSTAFQLVRSLGGFVEPVLLPTGALAITIAGAAAVLGTDYTVGQSGVITFTVAPASGAPLVWSGSFNWLCRFDDDKVDFSRMWTGFWEVKKLSFTSLLG